MLLHSALCQVFERNTSILQGVSQSSIEAAGTHITKFQAVVRGYFQRKIYQGFPTPFEMSGFCTVSKVGLKKAKLRLACYKVTQTYSCYEETVSKHCHYNSITTKIEKTAASKISPRVLI